MKTTFYVQVEPVFRRVSTGSQRLSAIQAERITKTKPTKPIAGAITVKLTLDIPEEAFMPLEPEAVIEIPVSHTHATPVVTVLSEEPGMGGDE